MVSNRMVVERREVGAVVSAGKSVISRLQELQKLYSRVCVILEEERSKDRKTWLARFLILCTHLLITSFLGLNQAILWRLQCPDSILLVSVFYSVYLRLTRPLSLFHWVHLRLCEVMPSL